jgi:hypothetical protein
MASPLRNRHVTLAAILSILVLLSAATPAASQTCATPPSGILHWWPADGNAQDIVGSNHGTLRNGTSFAPGIGQAFIFDGVDDRVDLTTPVSPAGNLTVEGWVNPASFGQFAPINRLTVIHADNGTPVFGFGILSDLVPSVARRIDLVARDAAGTVLFVRGSSQLSAGTWTHVAWTWNASTRTGALYVNGVFEGTATNPSVDVSSLPTLFAIGATSRGTSIFVDHFHGMIDELTVYSRVLAPGEIAAIYAASSAGKCKAIAYACDGFAAPFDGPIRLPARANRAIPLQMQLSNGALPITDANIAGAAPVVNVQFAPGVGPANDVTGLLEPIGQAHDGNSFSFDASTGQWQFKLGTRPFTAGGTYTVTATPGDASYTISPTCTGEFVRSE